jgi:hypothetical protein
MLQNPHFTLYYLDQQLLVGIETVVAFAKAYSAMFDQRHF